MKKKTLGNRQQTKDLKKSPHPPGKKIENGKSKIERKKIRETRRDQEKSTAKGLRSMVYIFAISVLFPLKTYAAFETKDISPYRVAVGGITSVVRSGVQDIFSNPASLVSMKQTEIYSAKTRLFEMEELTMQTIAIAIPFQRHALGAAYSSFGNNELYRETEMIIGYATKVGVIDIGCSMKNMTVEIPSPGNIFGKAEVFGVDAGIILHCGRRTLIGFSAKNCNRPQIGKYEKEDIYRDYSIGYCYKGKRCLLFTESYKAMTYPTAWRGGIDFNVTKKLFILTGLQTDPIYYAAGFRVKFTIFTIDYTYRYHPRLGGQHLFGMGIRIG